MQLRCTNVCTSNQLVNMMLENRYKNDRHKYADIGKLCLLWLQSFSNPQMTWPVYCLYHFVSIFIARVDNWPLVIWSRCVCSMLAGILVDTAYAGVNFTWKSWHKRHNLLRKTVCSVRPEGWFMFLSYQEWKCLSSWKRVWWEKAQWVAYMAILYDECKAIV